MLKTLTLLILSAIVMASVACDRGVSLTEEDYLEATKAAQDQVGPQYALSLAESLNIFKRQMWMALNDSSRSYTHSARPEWLWVFMNTDPHPIINSAEYNSGELTIAFPASEECSLDDVLTRVEGYVTRPFGMGKVRVIGRWDCASHLISKMLYHSTSPDAVLYNKTAGKKIGNLCMPLDRETLDDFPDLFDAAGHIDDSYEYFCSGSHHTSEELLNYRKISIIITQQRCDDFGHCERKPWIRATYNRETVERINWANFKREKIDDIADDYYVNGVRR